jgi:hypothetical protein
VKKGSVRRCVVVMQLPVLLSPKFGAKSSHIFMQSPLNFTVICRIDCLTFQDEPLQNNPLDVKENDEHALDFALHLSRLLSFPASFDFPCTGHAFFPKHLSNHCQSPSPTFSVACPKVDAVPLSDASRNKRTYKLYKADVHWEFEYASMHCTEN